MSSATPDALPPVEPAALSLDIAPAPRLDAVGGSVTPSQSSDFPVPLVDGVRILVCDDLNQITPYVLIEQGDWFEDELRFLRTWLKPGQQVVDIGANHGVYALSCAKAVGPAGRVWAFEPAPGTADRLSASVTLNGYAQVQVERSAVSGTEGQAELAVSQHSELNELVRGGADAAAAAAKAATVTVPLVTLDGCLDTLGWKNTALLKIDAEGEEAAILDGGRRFFATQSPLVMFELRAGRELHLHLVGRFQQMGYDCFRLVPGLNLLVPFVANLAPDAFLLNLFALRPERAAELAESGHLVQGPLPDPWQGVADRAPYHWSRVLTTCPYGRTLAAHWAQGDAAVAQAGGVALRDRDTVVEALALHALSRDRARPAAQRWAALRQSYTQLKTLCQRDTRHLRLSTLARVADEAGERGLAMEAVRGLMRGLAGLAAQPTAGPSTATATAPATTSAPLDPSEPFLPATARFDTVYPGAAIGAWVLASALEANELRGRHSSYFDPTGSQDNLLALMELGFSDDVVRRRLQMVQQRLRNLGAV